MERWNSFRRRYPELAEETLRLGSKIYELGAEHARGSRELAQFQKLLAEAPLEAREILGCEQEVSERSLLRAIFEQGSSLLLQYVRTGTC